MGKLFNTPVMLLFDTGASHSFISANCVTTLKLATKESEHRMEVVSPVGGCIEISRTCSNLEITLGELKIVANNLSVMIMWDVDIILGMERAASGDGKDSHHRGGFNHVKVIPTTSTPTLFASCRTTNS